MLGAIGCVATGAGLFSVVRGTAGVPAGVPAANDVPANVDSEFRFYASWYTVLGILVLRASRRPEAETVAVRACAGGFLLAAVSRLLSWRAVGRPSPFFRALAAVEFAIPAVLVPWQRSVRASRARLVP